MNFFKYETHMHTSETSGCAHNTGAEMADFYKNHGYAGVVVTDHVIPNGRVAESPDAWNSFVDRISAGYHACKARGDEIGLDVFYGWEYSAGWAHFLVYGLNPEWHRNKPDSMSWDIGTYLDRVRADGAYIIHAHPFREGVEPVMLYPSRTDAAEVLSAARTDTANLHADEFARMYGFSLCAGSDCHSTAVKRLCGLSSNRKLGSINELIEMISMGSGELFDDKLQ